MSAIPFFPPLAGDEDHAEPHYISASAARARLPALSYDDYLVIATCPADIRDLMYVHYLVARGDLDALIAHMSTMSSERQHQLVDGTDYHTYWGNTLHTCCYWNTGYAALVMYRYLVSLGAKPRHDYYDSMPWEVSGIVFSCPARGVRVTELERDPREFADGHAMIQNYFGGVCVIHDCYRCTSAS